jgi:hypothetical protein
MVNMRGVFVCVAAAAAIVGCTTSEPVDLRSQDADVLPIMIASGAAGQASATGLGGSTAGTIGATAGTSGIPASGSAGGAGSGIAGAGAAGAAGAQNDAGAVDAGSSSKDAGVPSDAAAAEVSAYAATWTDIYNKMLNSASYASNCMGGGCHNPGTQKGLDLSTQAKGYTTVKTKLVVGNPSASSIVSQLSSGKMPQARPKMPTVDLNVIKAWIMAGAPNN